MSGVFCCNPSCCVFLSLIAAFSFTLDSGGWADDEGLLEGFSLAAQPSSTRWDRDALLSEPGNVDGRLLVQSGLVVQQRHRPPRRRHLVEELQKTTD